MFMYSRTVHSLVYLLARYIGVKLVYVSPHQLSLPDEIVEELNSLNVSQTKMNLDDAIAIADVLYVTRIQKERFSSNVLFFKHTFFDTFPITLNIGRI